MAPEPSPRVAGIPVPAFVERPSGLRSSGATCAGVAGATALAFVERFAGQQAASPAGRCVAGLSPGLR